MTWPPPDLCPGLYVWDGDGFGFCPVCGTVVRDERDPLTRSLEQYEQETTDG